MPNHVHNELTFEGKPKRIQQVIKSLIGANGLVNFNSIIPMPPSLNINDESMSESLAYALEGKQSPYGHRTPQELIDHIKSKTSDAEFAKAIKTAKIRIANTKKYGYATWYGWSNAYWGTKWNAYDQSWTDDLNEALPKYKYNRKRKDKKATAYLKRLMKKRLQRWFDQNPDDVKDFYITFNTAWTCPEPIFEKLALNNPDVLIKVRYADEDTGSNCGEFNLKGGHEVYANIAPSYSEMTPEMKRKWTQFAIELRYGDVDPKEFGYDENWNYVGEDDE